MFIRDQIGDLFAPYQDKFNDASKNIEYNDHYFDTIMTVIGEHWSKSIVNPVLRIVYRGVQMVFRYNFYDYELAVIGNIPIILPERLLTAEHFFYQGFPEKYVIKERYTPGATTFIGGCCTRYQFYTVMFLLRDCIDNYYAATEDSE